MKYFKSSVSYTNGAPVFGSLDKDFVNGHVNEEAQVGYFSLLDEVVLPTEEGIESITREAFERALEEIQLQALAKRDAEFQETIKKLQEKKAEEEALREDVKAVKETFLTADERFKSLDHVNIPLDKLKKFKIAQLKEACTNAIYEGFDSEVTGHAFGFNELDQSNFTQQLLLIVATGGTATYNDGIQWKTKSGTVIELEPGEFLSVVGEATVHKKKEQNKYWELEVNTFAAKTNEDVVAIKWNEEVAAPL